MGVESEVQARFEAAGVPKAKVMCEKRSWTFRLDDSPAQLLELFRTYYGPTMNAFEAAAKNGKEADLARELKALFESQNKSGDTRRTEIPATYLEVTVTP